MSSEQADVAGRCGRGDLTEIHHRPMLHVIRIACVRARVAPFPRHRSPPIAIAHSLFKQDVCHARRPARRNASVSALRENGLAARHAAYQSVRVCQSS